MGKRAARQVWEYDTMAEFEADGGCLGYGNGPVRIGGVEYRVDDKGLHNPDKVLNLKITNGTVIADFATGITGFVAQNLGAGAALTSVENSNPLTGGKSIKLTQSGVAADIATTFDINVAPTMLESNTVIAVLGTIANPMHSRSESVGGVIVYTTTQASNFAGYGNANNETDESIDRNGGRFLSVTTGAALNAGGGGVAGIGRPGQIFDRMRIRLVLSGGSEMTIHGIIVNPMVKPACPIYFDDGWASQYTEAFTYMSRLGLVGTIGVVSNNVDGANYIKLAQMREMYEAGWDFVNHTDNHIYVNSGYGAAANSGTMDHVAVAQTVAAGGLFALSAGAVFDAPRHLVFKSAANEQSHEFVVTGIDENYEVVTERIWGRNATFWITRTIWREISSVVSEQATSGNVSLGKTKSYAEIYTSLAACQNWLRLNGFTRALDCYIAPGGETNILLERVAAVLGIKAIRLITSNVDQPFLNPRPYGIAASGSGIAAGGSATTIGYKDKGRDRMAHHGVYLHKIVPDTDVPTSIDAKVSDFRLFIDSVAADVRGGKLISPNMSDYKSMCGY